MGIDVTGGVRHPSSGNLTQGKPDRTTSLVPEGTMKALIALLIALWTAATLLSAGQASAAGLSLTWDLCATNAGAQTNKVFDCSDPSGFAQIFGVFNSPAPVDSAWLEISIDLQVDAPALPSFWQFNTTTTPWACNDGLISQSSRPPSSICSAVNPYAVGVGCPAVSRMTYHPGIGGPSRGRVVDSFCPRMPRVLTGVNYYGFHYDFLMATATEAGSSCDGCTTPAAIVWNSAVLRPDSPAKPTVEITGAGIVGNCVTVLGAASICSATPARNRTWGALKSLYRY
jgi:hypothetical protein